MAEAATSMTWTGLVRAVGRWFKENLPRAVIMSAISFGFAWVVNFFVMAFRWDGFRAPTEGGSDYIAAEGSLIVGSLFWVGVTSLLFALASYGYRVGWQQLVQEVVSLPTSIRQMFQGEERNRSLTTLAWAGMLSLVLGLLISPAVAAVAAGFFVVFATTPLGALLTGAIRRLWMQLIVRFAPHKGEPTNEVGAAAVSAAGMVAGFAVAAVLDSLILGIIAVILFGLAAYYFANEDELGAGTGTAVFLLIAAGVGLYELFEAGVGIAFADDGGWSECGDCNIIDYVTSTGATEVVSRSTVAGGGAGVGAPVGAAVGDVLGTIGGGGGGPAGGGGPTGGGGGGSTAPTGGGTTTTAPTGDTPTEDATQPAAGGDDADAILGAIGGGADGALAPAPEAGGTAPVDDMSNADADSEAPAARTGPVGTAATRPRDADGGATAPPTDGGEAEAATGNDADAILGAIGGGEGGVGGVGGAPDGDTGGAPDTAPGAVGDDTMPGDAEQDTAPGAVGATPTRRGEGQPADAPEDMPPPGVPPQDAPPTTDSAPADMPPPQDMPSPQDMPPPVVPPPPPAPPSPGDLPPAPEEALPPSAGPVDEPPPPEPPQQPADGDEQPSTGVWGRDASGWLNDTATRLGEAKDTLEGWIDDVWGEEDAAGIKETLQTEQIGENLGTITEVTDTYNHFHDMAGETIDDLNRLGVDENGQNAVTWLRVVAEGAGRATQTFVDGIVTPVMETVVAPFGGDAEEITHTLLPVQETAEEFSQAIHNGARNIRGGDNYAGQMAENRDLDLESLWRFP